MIKFIKCKNLLFFMQTESFITDTRWEILDQISREINSPKEISIKINQSLANVVKQVQLLEATGIINKTNQKEKGKPGKPKNYYEIGKEFLNLTLIRKYGCQKKTLKLSKGDYYQEFLINLIFLLKKEEMYALRKFTYESDLLMKAESMAIVNTKEKEIEIFIISDEHVEDIRKNHSNKEVKSFENKVFKIISWTHTNQEIKQGIKNKDKHFINLLEGEIIFDKKGLIKSYKEMVREG
jgi:predicted transcriptional regulator